MSLLTALLFFSTFSFAFFGMACFVAPRMKTEFIRYGLVKYRIMVGSLQLAGALGLVLGYFYAPVLGVIAASGLSLLMVLGFGVRLTIRDTVLQSAPALLYAVLNAYIAFGQFATLS